MAWVNWSRKGAAEPENVRGTLGVDLNASRARAALGRIARNKPVLLDDPHSDFPLAISLEKKTAEVGRAGSQIVRRLPHLVCAGYLPALGQPQEWRAGRHVFNAETALGLALEKLRPLFSHFEGVAFALPAYISLPQVAKFLNVVEKAKLGIRGTASTPLALAADRAALPHNHPEDHSRPGRPNSPTTALVIDIDDCALVVSLVRLADEEVRLLQTVPFPRLGLKVWKDRLLDSISDRCIRVCRRDPRDSSEAEQILYDQLEVGMDRARLGQRVSLEIRSAHWYQDLLHSPAEFEQFCSGLTHQAVEEIRHVIGSIPDADMPRSLWLTHDAGRLPGLTTSLHQNMGEGTAVRVLQPEAVASAIATLSERWNIGELPRTHLDTLIPLPAKALLETRDGRPNNSSGNNSNPPAPRSASRRA